MNTRNLHLMSARSKNLEISSLFNPPKFNSYSLSLQYSPCIVFTFSYYFPLSYSVGKRKVAHCFPVIHPEWKTTLLIWYVVLITIFLLLDVRVGNFLASSLGGHVHIISHFFIAEIVFIIYYLLYIFIIYYRYIYYLLYIYALHN